jgi:hypothetical protein
MKKAAYTVFGHRIFPGFTVNQHGKSTTASLQNIYNTYSEQSYIGGRQNLLKQKEISLYYSFIRR